MKRKLMKTIVRKAQMLMARNDYLEGKPPRKSSKTYIDAYAIAYADGEGHVHYNWSAF